MRLYWRLALDCRLHGQAPGCEADLGFRALLKLHQRDGTLFQAYALDGTPESEDTSVSFYGALLPLLTVRAPETAARLRRGPLSAKHLLSIAGQADRYYDLNWVWFGLALTSGEISRNTALPEAIMAAQKPAED